MTFDINTFKQTGLKYGGARPSLFVVEFAPPSGLLAVSTTATTTTGTGTTAQIQAGTLSRLTCKAAALPEAVVAEIEVGYFGRRIKVAGERAFQDWQVTVINDENFLMRAVLEDWSNGINRLESNIRDPLFDVEGYKAVVNVRQYSKTGVEIRAYQMIGAWPSQVSAIGLDWDQGNAIEYFACTWAYDYWLPITELSTDGAPQYASSATNLNNAPAG
jgi:Straboviridae tail tube protein Gp19